MKGRRWPAKKVTEALESLALTNHISATARAVGVPASTIARWKNHHGDRLESIKKRNAEIHERITTESIEKMTKRHARAGVRLQDTGLVSLEHLDLEEVSAFGVARLVTAGIDVERTARGEAAVVVDVTVWDRIKREMRREEVKMGADQCILCGGQLVRGRYPGKGAYKCSGCGNHVTLKQYAARVTEFEPCRLCGGGIKRTDLGLKCSGCGTEWAIG